VSCTSGLLASIGRARLPNKRFDGARRLRNESFFGAPQLKRAPLGRWRIFLGAELNRQRTLAQLVVLAGLCAACARAVYTCVNELDVPGACPPDTVKHGAFAVTADSLIPTDSVVGYVVAQFSGSPIQNARVTITSDTTRTFLTDSTGRFAAPRVTTPSWIVGARMLGYRPRVDTVTGPGEISTIRGIRFRIGLEAQGTDGPCSGFAMLCGKRP